MIVDAGSMESRELLELASELNMFDNHYNWMIVVDSLMDYEGICDVFRGLNVSISSRITVYWNRVDYLDVKLYDIWNPSHMHGGQLVVTEMGQFTNKSQLLLNNLYQNSTLIRRRIDMQGITLRVNYVILKELEEPLEILLNARYKPTRENLSRFTYSLLNVIRDMFNLTYFQDQSKSWGYLQEDGTFDGMIGMMVRKEVDVGGTSMFLRSERHEVLSYTSETWYLRTCFIFQQPDYSTNIQNPFLQPFSGSVWIIFGVICIVFIFMLGLFERLRSCGKDSSQSKRLIYKHPKSFKNIQHNKPNFKNIKLQTGKKLNLKANKLLNKMKRSPKSKSKAKMKPQKNSQRSDRGFAIFNQFLDGLLTFISVISLQGYLNKKANLMSLKITVLTLMLFGFMIAQFYSGSIVSSILDVKHVSIRTLEDLYKSHLNLALENVPYDIYIFNKTKDPLLNRIYHEKIIKYDKRSSTTETNIFQPEYGVKLIKSGSYAFHVQESTAYEIISKTFDENSICKLSEIEAYRPTWLIVSLQKNSSFRELYTYGLRRLKEVGIMHRWAKIFFLKKPKCERNLKVNDLSIDVTAIYPLLILLSFGYLMSFLVLLGEMYIFRG
ncbi:ionotropic receptor 75a-like [Chironomus tepperi]|uniref:ionotropic receptor 75a-like n=1 Tax=Chironomus tepperi TaxID=113505 RepID=UPI00391F7808